MTTTYIVTTEWSTHAFNTRKEANIYAKVLKKEFNQASTITKSDKRPTTTVTYYRDNAIEIIEERQNGWSLVNNCDHSNMMYFANTKEIEYREVSI